MTRWFCIHNESGDLRETSLAHAEQMARIARQPDTALASGRFSAGSWSFSTRERLTDDETRGHILDADEVAR